MPPKAMPKKGEKVAFRRTGRTGKEAIEKPKKASIENKMFKGGFAKNKTKVFNALIAPAKKPKKELSSFKKEFATKAFIKKQSDDQTMLI